MFKGIVGSRYINVSGGSPTTPYIPSGGRSAGMIRYNESSANIEVYDGAMWKELSSPPVFIDLADETRMILDWAKQKMEDEEKYKILAEKHVAVKLALDNLERAKQQLDATIILSKEHEKTTS
jgi:hypothetical protein